MKTCSRCHLSEPNVTFYANRQGRTCKKCVVEMGRLWRQANRDRHNATTHKWRDDNRAHYNEMARRHKAANRDKIREKARIAYWANPEKARAYLRNWQAKNRAKVSAFHLKWARKRPEKARATVKRWREKHPEEAGQFQVIRRARVKGAEGSHSLAEWRALLDSYEHKCAYCGIALDKSNRTRDHKVPLARGGSNRIDNILPACRVCNSAKNTRTHNEYLSGQTLLGR